MRSVPSCGDTPLRTVLLSWSSSFRRIRMPENNSGQLYNMTGNEAGLEEHMITLTEDEKRMVFQLEASY